MTEKSVLIHPQGQHPGARALTAPFATSLQQTNKQINYYCIL